MKKLDEALYNFLCGACAFLMFCMVSLIAVQVIFRYVFHASLTWSEELGRYIFIWITFLGMAAALKKGSHVALDLLIKALHGTSKKVLIALNGFILSLMSIAMIYSGITLVQLGVGQKSPALKLPMHMVYIAVPVSGLLLLYFVVRIAWLEYHSVDTEQKVLESDMHNEGGDAV